MSVDTPPARRVLGSLALLVFVGLASRDSFTPSTDPRAEAEILEKLASQPEAREWIRMNGRRGPLASNRFKGKEDALAFVNALYEAGAVRVVVDDVNDDEIEMAEGGPYADALIVRLPDDSKKRSRLLAIVDSESNGQLEPAADIGPKTLYFWWD